jgi:hypothetical protein
MLRCARDDAGGLLALARVGTLACHAAPVVALVACGGLAFSASRDLALAAWTRPRVGGGRRPPAIAADGAALTCAAGLGDVLLTGDDDGRIKVKAATRYRETLVERAPGTTDADVEAVVVENSVGA